MMVQEAVRSNDTRARLVLGYLDIYANHNQSFLLCLTLDYRKLRLLSNIQ